MIKAIVAFILFSFVFIRSARVVEAKFDPFTQANNKYGIHILDINDLSDAAALVNSNGGLWGYVTIVIQEDDRNFEKWQGVFDRMRRYHLIPIVRIATKIQGNSWAIPTHEGIDDWVRFLDSLNWPIENRYVILYNEPNHAKEWGNTINPEEYASLATAFAQKLHSKSDDFFVLPAGLDVSAASSRDTLDADVFLIRMVQKEPQFLNLIDGWNSHSYPNPAFSGSVYAKGRGTLTSYLWELERLRALGQNKPMPVFITETGWVHREGMAFYTSMLSADAVAQNMRIAAERVWTDNRIVAVTPFVLSYQGAPFDHFSWKKLSQSDYYPQYDTYQGLAKVKGTPWQREKYTLRLPLIPETLVAGSTYTLQAPVSNQGQGILSSEGGYTLNVVMAGNVPVVSDSVPTIEPGQSGMLVIHIDIPGKLTPIPFSVYIRHGNRSELLQSGTVKIIPPPSASLQLQLGWRTLNTTTDVTVLIYDESQLLHKFHGLESDKGTLTVEGLRSIVPGKRYRVVVLVPYYLPRQLEVVLGKGTTKIPMPRLYPVDYNRDGTLSWKDTIALFRMKPHDIISLIIGP